MSLYNFDSVFTQYFPFWSKLSANDRELICNSTKLVKYPKATNLHNGNGCTGVFIVKSGALRLYMLSDEGKEITLYRLFPGEMCMLSASCVIQSITFDVFIDSEEDSECYLIPGNVFSEVAERVPDMKIFSLEMAVSRFSDVMWVMQQILFMSLDKRLAIFLLDEISIEGSDTIKLTHEQIAKYMGSAREVVSRMLKYFSNEGIVEVSRGGIKILNKAKLRNIAS